MPYSASNPPVLLEESSDGSVPNLWSYVSSDTHAQVASTAYFTNAANLGMKLGDLVFAAEADNGYSTATFSVSSINGSGAATVSRGQQMGVTAGTGITAGTGTVYLNSVTPFGNYIKTDIIIDITGLTSGGTANDIIGVNGGGAAHLGRVTASRNGTIIFGRMTCLEAPVGGGTDIDLYAADEATGVEDDAIGGLTETQLINAGVSSAGSSDVMTALPNGSKYLYLAEVGGTNTIYTAGKFLIEMWGIPV